MPGQSLEVVIRPVVRLSLKFSNRGVRSKRVQLQAEPVSNKRDEKRRTGPAGQSGGDHVLDPRRAEPELGEVDPEENPDTAPVPSPNFRLLPVPLI